MAETIKPDFNKTLDDFYKYLYEIVKLYETILPILKEELDAIQQDDIISLDKNLKMQQALLYQTKNFDSEVVGYTSKLNLEANDLSSLILQMPEDQQLRFYALLGRFTAAIQEVGFYKDKCRVILQTRLYSIEKALMKHAGRKESRTYDRDASETHTIFPKSFETTI
mgnify:CR=1 FL=1